MWARLESNTIKEILTRPKALTIGGVQYPSNIFSMWTESELSTIGIVPITMDSTNFKDKEYYTNTSITYAYNTETGKATGTYGTATAKDLTQLKTERKNDINTEAGSILRPTDWMIVRATEGGTAVPSDITTKRAAVRTKANSMCVQIDGASDVDEVAALYLVSNTGTEESPVYTRPLGELPEV